MGIAPTIVGHVTYYAWGAFRGDELYLVDVYGKTQCIKHAESRRGKTWDQLTNEGWSVAQIEVRLTEPCVVTA